MSYPVGYRSLLVTDATLALTFPVVVLYPSAGPEQPEQLGPYELSLARAAEPAPGRFPVVLISHGTGGSGLVYRTLAHFLASQGFVVGLPEHPHNNRADDSWAQTPQNLTARPRHLQLALDAVLHDSSLAPATAPDAVALIGHSLGGYTALALAGGTPTTLPRESADGRPRLIPTPTDGRIRALVLLAPATPWFRAPDTLCQIQVPVLLLTAEKDQHTGPWHAQNVLRGLPDPARVQHREVANAGHFSFLSPFPAARVSRMFPPSQDPPGFDRAQFQQELQAEVLTFLRAVLQPAEVQRGL
ncbi:alpha/beta hydrolase family protein [Hymenobacter chitinivorans]|uniref:Putative dienelactone hydrolase n=1 Tax=Hymenobacter chitinivorans DSM 11115 TaxID=1121954 RepID=A0A2M9BPN8_9BACT|nr:alpha/beta fold hydrolase [Hymenobacter chitinivorans]PJJ59900.1 putative dienelactone hydrolase [Hymenobacter chitinivorans DSM 11115]